MNLIFEHVETWLILAFVGLLTALSDKIVGRVRFALNRADLRSKYYEELARDLSAFVFYADLFHVRHIRGESDFADLPAICDDVNEAFVTLKTKEYVYRSWITRYWSQKRVKGFESVMQATTAVYEAIIEFNEKGNEHRKTEALGRYLIVLKSSVDQWLSKAA
jgi:hypothetical protein